MASCSSSWHMKGSAQAMLALTANPAGTQASDAMVS